MKYDVHMNQYTNASANDGHNNEASSCMIIGIDIEGVIGV